MLYELALLDMDRSSARRAVKFQFLLPAAFLFCAPMSDSLFLLLSVTCLYLMRKEQFLAACLMAGLAAFTRVQGVLLIAPLLMEMIRHCLNERRVAPETFRPWRHVGRFTSLLVVLLGFGLYLYINYDVTGNPLQFLTYQKEHWNQQLGWFFNTAAYQTEELVLCSVNDLPQALGLWLPNLIALLGGLVLVLPALRFTPKTAEELLQEEETPAQEAIRAASPLRASYGLYYLVYYFFSMGATWLLSAPRYLACAVPLSLALALVTKKRWVNGLMTILLLVLQVLYLAAYVQGWHVY